MTNVFDEMRQAVQEARVRIDAVDGVVGAMADLIVGRLRRSKASPSTLTRLKKELQDWNIHTGKWKQK